MKVNVPYLFEIEYSVLNPTTGRRKHAKEILVGSILGEIEECTSKEAALAFSYPSNLAMDGIQQVRQINEKCFYKNPYSHGANRHINGFSLDDQSGIKYPLSDQYLRRNWPHYPKNTNFPDWKISAEFMSDKKDLKLKIISTDEDEVINKITREMNNLKIIDQDIYIAGDEPVYYIAKNTFESYFVVGIHQSYIRDDISEEYAADEYEIMRRHLFGGFQDDREEGRHIITVYPEAKVGDIVRDQFWNVVRRAVDQCGQIIKLADVPTFALFASLRDAEEGKGTTIITNDICEDLRELLDKTNRLHTSRLEAEELSDDVRRIIERHHAKSRDLEMALSVGI